MITVSELINSAVSQIASGFLDQDREATIDDAMQMLQVMLMIVKAFTEREAERMLQDGDHK